MSTSLPASTFKLEAFEDPLRVFRDEFVIPTNAQMKAGAVAPELADEPCTYLCGNSLGVLPKRSKQYVEEELQVWAARGVEGHFDHPYGRDWMHIADFVHPLLAKLVGARESEVACMGTLTANLNLMMNTFYKPTEERYKILCEARAFPSDQYAIATQVAGRGLDRNAVIEMWPRDGEYTLRTSDILDVIAREGSSIALVMFSGVQYYTGQAFAIETITRAAKAQGCMCGWDLAHAVGNLPLSLHDWDIDFAVWCTYKYLNSGPGAIGGLFVHERWADEPIRAAGWWGHDPTTRFDMPPVFARIRGAQGFQQSNPSVLATVSVLGSLEVFKEAGWMKPIRARSLRLTGYLEALLHASRFYVPVEQASKFSQSAVNKPGVTIITPARPDDRGAQLSLLFLPTGRGVMPCVLKELGNRGVVGDSRKPDVIRIAPCPLYNSFEDVERSVQMLEEAMETLVERGWLGGSQ